MNNGWIKLHRQILDNPIADKPNYAWLWIVLLLKANHRENSFIWNGKKQICQEGQILTGRKKLSQETGIPEGSIETILNYLESEHQIEQQKTTKFRLITVKNWDKYQVVEQQFQQQNNNRITTDEQQNNTNKNDKKEKNEKKIIPKGITQSVEYGNTLVNKIIFTLKAFNGTDSLDGTVGENRKYAHLLAKNKIKPEFKNRTGSEATDEEIVASLNAILQNADDFHRKNLTNTKYIYYNFIKLINVKSKIKSL